MNILIQLTLLFQRRCWRYDSSNIH